MPGDFVNFLDVPVDNSSNAANLIPSIVRGLQLSAMPQQLNADLKSQQLKNALNAINLKYAGPMNQASLAEKQSLAPYYQAMIQKMNSAQNAPQSSLAKLQSDYNNAASQFGSNSDQAQQLKQAIQMALQGKSGVTVFDPKTGAPLVNVGGTSGSSRGGGGTYVNPQTGEVISRPTTAQNTQLQRGLMGENNVEQFMNQYISTLPQFQTVSKKALSSAEGLANRFGANFDLPSQLAYGKASLNTAAEGLLKTLGLNATGENLHTARDILAPQSGESPQGFKDRAMRQVQQFAQVKNRLENQLSGGYNVGQANSPYAMTPEQIDRYHQLLGGQIGQSILPNSQQTPMSTSESVPQPQPGAVVIQTPDGKYWQVDKSKASQALKKYSGSKVVSNG